MCFVFIAKFSNDFKRCQILVEMLKRFPDTIPKIGVSIYIGVELIDSVCVCVCTRTRARVCSVYAQLCAIMMCLHLRTLLLFLYDPYIHA